MMKKAVTFKDLIESFVDGESEGVSSTGTLIIKGNQLIHYKTPISERYEDKFIVNVTRYSLATGQLQKQLRTIIPEDKQIVIKKVPVDYVGTLRDFVN